MCGRFGLIQDVPDIVDGFVIDADTDITQLEPNYNVAPSQDCAVMYTPRGSDKKHLSLFRWGLIPSWVKDKKIGYKLINARSETAHERPSFRHAFKSNRALVPMSGWYEWRKTASGKQPFFHHSRDGNLLWVAGLTEYWTDRDTGEIVHSFTILTQDAYDEIADIHSRMPVLMNREGWLDWLDPTQDVARMRELVASQPKAEISIEPVTTRMNSPRFNYPECMEPIKP